MQKITPDSNIQRDNPNWQMAASGSYSSRGRHHSAMDSGNGMDSWRDMSTVREGKWDGWLAVGNKEATNLSSTTGSDSSFRGCSLCSGCNFYLAWLV